MISVDPPLSSRCELPKYLDLAKHAFHVIILTEELRDARLFSTDDVAKMQTNLIPWLHVSAFVHRILTIKP